MSNFKRDWDKSKKKIDDAMNKAIRGAVIELFGEIIKRTPVGNPSLWKNEAPEGYVGGTLRGNWQIGINSVNSKKTSSPDKSGASTLSKGSAVINNFTVGTDKLFISNNLPYAERVEYGWSSQRPTGMVRTTVKQFQPIVEKIARKYRV